MEKTAQTASYEKPEIVDSFDSLEVVGDAGGIPPTEVHVGCGSRIPTVSA